MGVTLATVPEKESAAAPCRVRRPLRPRAAMGEATTMGGGPLVGPAAAAVPRPRPGLIGEGEVTSDLGVLGEGFGARQVDDATSDRTR